MSHIRKGYNDYYRKECREQYNYTTGAWEFLDWDTHLIVEPLPTQDEPDKRRDSGQSRAWTQAVAGAEQGTQHQGYAIQQSPTASTSRWNTSTLGYNSQQYPIAGSASYSTSSHATGYTQPPTTPHSGSRSRRGNAASGRSLPRGQGAFIQGDYDGNNLHYEVIDQSFFVRTKSFFTVGRVFAVMWNETASVTAAPIDYTTQTSINSVRATTKRGVRPAEHAVVYTLGYTPQLLQGETGITKASIGVSPAEGSPILSTASRIYFGIHHPIQYNVRVKDIGHVFKDHISTLIGNWREEDDKDTGQAQDVTANAERPDLEPVHEEPPVSGTQGAYTSFSYTSQ